MELNEAKGSIGVGVGASFGKLYGGDYHIKKKITMIDSCYCTIIESIW